MIYAIGDIQGCLNYLHTLLEHIQFNENDDTLWFAGDLVNRGPDSLNTLRFIKNLGAKHRVVLGNHDLHLLAILHGARAPTAEDTLDEIIHAPDRDELTAWLKQQSLLHYDPKENFLLVHAGLAPSWDLAQACDLAREVETIIRGEHAKDFFAVMYGNTPTKWENDLQGMDRLRCITNFLTRVRYCYPDGSLSFAEHDPDTIPWFKLPARKTHQQRIIFGHWAALAGQTHTPNVFAIDTGCIWGYALTAMRLSDQQCFYISCRPLGHGRGTELRS